MMQKVNDSNRQFFAAGINYKKSDISIRGQFAISTEQYKLIAAKAAFSAINEFFILSTCNRTEIYGVAESPDQLIDLLCSQTIGEKDTFIQLAYIKEGEEAIEHLFNVGAGLDSQLLGDYEIVGQIRQAVKTAKSYNFIGVFLDRLVNAVMQCSKAIKRNTLLSGGTVSVSFSAIKYIRENSSNILDKKILLIGTGKIGRAACRNMVDYLQTNNITLINRSPETAAALAGELQLEHRPIEALAEAVQMADIILIATSAGEPVLLKSHFGHTGAKLIIDFSVPCSVEGGIEQLPDIQLVNVDDLSRLQDDTFRNREQEVPKVKSIIQEHIEALRRWYQARSCVPALRAIKSKLQQMHACPIFTFIKGQHAIPITSSEHSIQRILNSMANKMQQQERHGCFYIEAINEYIRSTAN